MEVEKRLSKEEIDQMIFEKQIEQYEKRVSKKWYCEICDCWLRTNTPSSRRQHKLTIKHILKKDPTYLEHY